jgi:hypothetical protein
MGDFDKWLLRVNREWFYTEETKRTEKENFYNRCARRRALRYGATS